MPPSDPDGRAWGILFARLVLGLIFFQGAWWRVFGIGPVFSVDEWRARRHDG